jgi:hypothetical protein
MSPQTKDGSTAYSSQIDLQQWISDLNGRSGYENDSVSLPNDVMMVICSYQNDSENLNKISKLNKEKQDFVKRLFRRE